MTKFRFPKICKITFFFVFTILLYPQKSYGSQEISSSKERHSIKLNFESPFVAFNFGYKNTTTFRNLKYIFNTKKFTEQKEKSHNTLYLKTFAIVTLHNKDLELGKSLSPSELFFTKKDISLGEKLFFFHCNACHMNGDNYIIPEKNLQKKILEANGLTTISNISYQIRNGKNTMPAFGGRLTEKEMEQIANYILNTF